MIVPHAAAKNETRVGVGRWPGAGSQCSWLSYPVHPRTEKLGGRVLVWVTSIMPYWVLSVSCSGGRVIWSCGHEVIKVEFSCTDGRHT